MNHLLAFGGVQVTDAFEQCQRIVSRNRLLFCIDFCFRFDVSLGKKLLRFSAAYSARPVVAPIEFCHECFSGYGMNQLRVYPRISTTSQMSSASDPAPVFAKTR